MGVRISTTTTKVQRQTEKPKTRTPTVDKMASRDFLIYISKKYSNKLKERQAGKWSHKSRTRWVTDGSEINGSDRPAEVTE